MSNKYKRLEGLTEALKEGFTHTNKARVEMSPDEELMKREARKMPPASQKDIKKIEESLGKAEKDPEPRKKVVPKKKPKEIKDQDSTEV